MAPKQGGLYRLDPSAIGKTKGLNNTSSHITPIAVYDNKTILDSTLANKVACNSPSLTLLHNRLGHTSLSKMKHIEMCKSHVLHNFFCEVCILAKSHRLSFNKSSISTPTSFHLVHMDL